MKAFKSDVIDALKSPYSALDRYERGGRARDRHIFLP
jgi:hypothetical protein